VTLATGILSYGTYLPSYRLQRSAIKHALGAGGGNGTRSIAGSDEDATTLGVAAARRALYGISDTTVVRSVWLATTSAPYADKTNAVAIHAALGLGGDIPAYDLSGSVRCAAGALAAATDGALVVLSDLRGGLPGSGDEREGGDGAAAIVLGSGPVLAELVGRGASTAEFLDRWRVPGELGSRTWEERFGEQVYVSLGSAAAQSAADDAKVALTAVDHIAITGVHPRAARTLARSLDVKPDVLIDDLASTVGNCGTAHLGLVLALALDRASPGDTIALLVLADGADAFVFRCTERLIEWREGARPQGGDQGIANDVSYTTYLRWRGHLHTEPPRRPPPDLPVAPASYRGHEWKFAFCGSRCGQCGTMHLPPQRVCAACGALDAMTPEPAHDAKGTIVTVTADHLAYSPDPPMVVAVVNLDNGGRVQCEMTDLGLRTPTNGDRVEMTFRRAYTVDGVHNYVWKARLAAPHLGATHG